MQQIHIQSFHGLFQSFLACDGEEGALLYLVGRFDVDRAVYVGMRQHAQDGFDDFLDFLVGQPLLFAQHLLAGQTVLDVGVIDGRPELEEGEFEGELFGEVDVDDELGAFVGTSDGSVDDEFPVVEVFLEGGDDSSE